MSFLAMLASVLIRSAGDIEELLYHKSVDVNWTGKHSRVNLRIPSKHCRLWLLDEHYFNICFSLIQDVSLNLHLCLPCCYTTVDSTQFGDMAVMLAGICLHTSLLVDTRQSQRTRTVAPRPYSVKCCLTQSLYMLPAG